MDRLSCLPEIILHDILSRLPEKDAARTSILSKAWKDAWSTFPILVFNDYNHGLLGLPDNCDDPQQKEEHMRKEINLLNIVDNTLLRFHGQGLAIKEFKFSISSIIYKSVFPHFDHWLQLACESGVEVLSLHYIYEFITDLDECYSLPPIVLGAKSLTKLVLSGCIRVDQAFLNHPANFSSLQSLSLTGVYLQDEQIQNLFSICPLIEYLTLLRCDELKYLRVHGLPKLKVVEVSGAELAEVFVDAPNLEYFHYDNRAWSLLADFACNINVDKCRNLRRLRLESVRTIVITNQWLIRLFQKFPLLERLELKDCFLSKWVKISSEKLKVLEFSSFSNLEIVYVDTSPNLYSCKFHWKSWDHGGTMPIISFWNCSSQLKFSVFLTFGFGYSLDIKKLREFLQKIRPGEVLESLSLNILNENVDFNRNSLQDISVPPPSIKHLKLSLFSNKEAFCLSLVNGLFWSCRPATISLSLGIGSKMFTKLLCEKLLGGKEDDQCCSSSPIKCWWHGLKNVKVSCNSKIYENLVDFKTFLDAFQTLDNLSLKEKIKLPLVDIDFKLEWLP